MIRKTVVRSHTRKTKRKITKVRAHNRTVAQREKTWKNMSNSKREYYLRSHGYYG